MKQQQQGKEREEMNTLVNVQLAVINAAMRRHVITNNNETTNCYRKHISHHRYPCQC